MFLQLFALVILFIIVYWYLSKPKNLPPGPIGIPILGYLPWILYYSKDRLSLFNKLKSYGNIVCLRVGFQHLVFLNDFDTIKEAFTKKGDHFSGRPMKLLQKEVTHSKGILSLEGKYQRENRRFILRSLRNIGFGKMSFEEPILDSIQTMCEAIDKHISEHPNESMDFRQCLTEAVADNISRIVLGIKFDKDELKFMIERLKLAQEIPPIFFMTNSFPFLIQLSKFKLLRKLIGIDQFKTLITPMQNLVMKYVQAHKLSFDPNNISDFIYGYLEEQTKHQSTKEESYWWDDEQIQNACSDLIGAGLGTTNDTVTWFLFLMANNQEWLAKVTNEIDTVIGKERKPSTRDLSNLPLCEASILETLRWSSLAVTGIPHSTTENTTLLGYFIPKDTTVFPNLYNVAMVKDIFPDPFNFNPSANFLNQDQKEVINRDKFLPFGIGRRSCIGESLARMELILFFVAIFQRYSVSLDPKLGMTKKTTGLFCSPGHRILRFHSRI